MDSGRVLVVDDEVYNCEVLRAIIMKLGVKDPANRLTLCTDPEEALEKYKECFKDKERAYRVVFTDLCMPEMDGYELTRRIRQLTIDEESEPMIAALTGHTETEFFKKALEVGCNLVYPKPINSQQIKTVLE